MNCDILQFIFCAPPLARLCLLIKRLHHQVTLNHILKSEPAIPHNYPTGATCAFVVMPSPQFSQFQTGPFQGRCLRRKQLSFQLNPQQFPLYRRQYFLTAVMLCFFTVSTPRYLTVLYHWR